MARKGFNTSIEEAIQERFKESCIQKNVNMNDVLEVFMQQFSDNEIIIEKSITLKKARKI